MLWNTVVSCVFYWLVPWNCGKYYHNLVIELPRVKIVEWWNTSGCSWWTILSPKLLLGGNRLIVLLVRCVRGLKFLRQYSYFWISTMLLFTLIREKLEKIRNCSIKSSNLLFVGWKVRCAEYFPYSTYFEGKKSSIIPNSVYSQVANNAENGSANHSGSGRITDTISPNGKLDGFKDLTIWKWCWI